MRQIVEKRLHDRIAPGAAPRDHVERHVVAQRGGIQRLEQPLLHVRRREMPRQIAEMVTGQDQQRDGLHVVGVRGDVRGCRRQRHLRRRIGSPRPFESRDAGRGEPPRPREQRMAAPAVRELTLDEERRVLERRHAMPEIADRDLHVAAQQPFLEIARRPHRDHEAHRLVAPPKARDRLAHARVRADRRVADEADRKRADERLVHVPRFARECVDGRVQLLRERVEALALRRQPKAAAPALAQPEADARLERRQLRADRRLAHVQRRLRGAHAARVRHRDEHADQPKVQVRQGAEHVFSSLSSPSRAPPIHRHISM